MSKYEYSSDDEEEHRSKRVAFHNAEIEEEKEAETEEEEEEEEEGKGEEKDEDEEEDEGVTLDLEEIEQMIKDNSIGEMPEDPTIPEFEKRARKPARKPKRVTL